MQHRLARKQAGDRSSMNGFFMSRFFVAPLLRMTDAYTLEQACDFIENLRGLHRLFIPFPEHLIQNPNNPF